MSFFTQFEKLRLNVPRISLINVSNENCTFANFTFNCKNCYSCTGSDYCNSSQYGYWNYHNFHCTDCSFSFNCNECYECIDCEGCNNSNYLQDCANSESCSYCYDCENCADCFACIGLIGKKYYIYNKQYSMEQYLETVAKLRKKSPEELRELFRDIKRNRPHVYMHKDKTTNACTGDYVYNSAQCISCFDVDKCEKSTYLNNAINCRNCLDISFAGENPVTDCYEIMSGMDLKNSLFCAVCWQGRNLEYCEYCFGCEDCFGCTGLKNKKFHILNNAYSQNEYFAKVKEIKEQMIKDGIFGHWFASAYPLADTLAT